MLDYFKRFLNKVSPYLFSRENAKEIAGSLTISILKTGSEVATPYIFTMALTSLNSGEDADIGVTRTSPLVITGLYVGMWFLTQLLTSLQKIIITPLAARTARKFSVEYLDYLLHLPLDYHLRVEEGTRMQLFNKAFRGSYEFVTPLFTQVVPTSLTVLTAIGVLSSLGSPIIGISLAAMLVVSTIYNSWTAKKVAYEQAFFSMEDIAIIGEISNVISIIDTVIMLGNTSAENANLAKGVERLEKALARSSTVSDKLSLGQLSIVTLGFMVAMLLEGNKVINKTRTIDDFVFIAYYLLQFAAPLYSFGEAVNKMRASYADILHVFNFFTENTLVSDGHKTLQVAPETATIVFDKVTFAYPKKPHGNNNQVAPNNELELKHEAVADMPPVLQNFSLEIPAGQNFGIVGTSGSGKSTIANLLLRLYEVNSDSGKITINGQDIREVTAMSLRSAIGVVPQNTSLSNNSLSNNVKYAALYLGQNISDSDVLDAIRRSGLSEYENRLDENVGERGLGISGGQRQRVAIARALIKKPSIFVFDEATSALDRQTETEVQKNLDAASKGVTTLTITHRLRTIVNSDKILVLDKGKICETGSHTELMNKKGIYAKLWEDEQKSVDEAIAKSKSKPQRERDVVNLDALRLLDGLVPFNFGQSFSLPEGSSSSSLGAATDAFNEQDAQNHTKRRGTVGVLQPQKQNKKKVFPQRVQSSYDETAYEYLLSPSDQDDSKQANRPNV